MNECEIHQELIRGISEQQKTILDSSGQGMYIYLDDSHVIFNQQFATLLGYGSPREMEMLNEPFLSAFVAEKSHSILVNAYKKAMNKMEGSTFEVSWKKKVGGEVKATVILTPIMYDNHLFAIHYIFA